MFTQLILTRFDVMLDEAPAPLLVAPAAGDETGSDSRGQPLIPAATTASVNTVAGGMAGSKSPGTITKSSSSRFFLEGKPVEDDD